MLIDLCLTQLSSEKFPLQEIGTNIEATTRHYKQRDGDLGTSIPKWDIFIETFPSGLRETCRRGDENS